MEIKWFVAADRDGDHIIDAKTYDDAVTKVQNWLQNKVTKTAYIYKEHMGKIQLFKVVRHYIPRS